MATFKKEDVVEEDIIQLLIKGDKLRAVEIARELDKSHIVVSQHLRKLRKLEKVKMKKEGPCTYWEMVE